MQRILIDNARRRLAEKRGGTVKHIPWDDIDVAARADDSHLLRIDEALAALAQEDEASATLVRLRFFGGLNLDESAHVLGVSERTAKRYWSFARAWLFHRLQSSG